MSAVLWAAALGLPLLTAITLGVLRTPLQNVTRRARAATIGWCQVALLPALALTLTPAITGGATTTFDALLIGMSFRLDTVSRPLVLVAVVLYGAALTSITRRRTERAAELEAFLLVCFTGNIGVYTAADAVTFYLFFAMMSFAAVGLVLNTRSAFAHRAAKIYLILTVISETAVLATMILTVHAGGMDLVIAGEAVAASPYRDLIVILAMVGFGTKAGLVPLHVWLPLAHPAAPPAASAVLSGAMVKAGLVGWLRFFPLGAEALYAAGTLMVILGVIGAFATVPIGLTQRDPKAVLAYSTISQMGFLAIVVGVALAAPDLAALCVSAAVVYAVHHGLAKGAAFMGVGVWKHHGHRWHGWLVGLGLAVAAVAIVGAPLSSGSVGKYAAKNAVEGVVLGGLDLVSVLPWVATGSTLLLLRYAVLLRESVREPVPEADDQELWAWLGLVLLCIPVPWIVGELWVPLAAIPEVEVWTLWDATWPVLVGLAVAAAAWPLRHRLARVPELPSGDLVVVYAAAGRGVSAWLRALRRRLAGSDVERPDRLPVLGRRVGRVEDWLSSWTVSLVVMVGLVAMMLVVGL